MQVVVRLPFPRPLNFNKNNENNLNSEKKHNDLQNLKNLNQQINNEIVERKILNLLMYKDSQHSINWNSIAKEFGMKEEEIKLIAQSQIQKLQQNLNTNINTNQFPKQEKTKITQQERLLPSIDIQKFHEIVIQNDFNWVEIASQIGDGDMDPIVLRQLYFNENLNNQSQFREQKHASIIQNQQQQQSIHNVNSSVTVSEMLDVFDRK